MNKLMKNFPIHAAFPERRIANNKKYFLELINRYNSVKNCYYSLYALDELGGFTHSNIDKVAWDFDGELAHEHANRLADWCIKKNYLFCIFFSGKKGFHIYIFTKNGDKLINNTYALKSTHKTLEKEVGILNDFHIVGDIARIMRVPNTLHLGSKLYCRPLTINQLKKPLIDIKELAKKQCLTTTYYGEKLLNIKKYDG